MSVETSLSLERPELKRIIARISSLLSNDLPNTVIKSDLFVFRSLSVILFLFFFYLEANESNRAKLVRT